MKTSENEVPAISEGGVRKSYVKTTVELWSNAQKYYVKTGENNVPAVSEVGGRRIM